MQALFLAKVIAIVSFFFNFMLYVVQFLIDVQHFWNIVFSIGKGPDRQNHFS